MNKAFHPWSPLFIAATLGALSCSGARNTGPQFSEADQVALPLPGPKGGDPRLPPPTSEPEELPGIDTKDLVPRERSQWWKLVSSLYSPCEDQAVSIAQCVKEARPCTACPAAARLLASRAKTGATVTESENVYAARFGPSVKKADLKGAPSKGPEDAPVTIVVWSDFGCPACKMALPIIDEVFEKRSPFVRVVHKPYPLPQHTHSSEAARASIAAHAQGRYWEMERILFDNQQKHAESDLLGYASSLKLDMKRFKADMASESSYLVIEKSRAEANRAGLTGTPFILINGRQFDSTYFTIVPDLDEWVALEIELARTGKPAEKKAAADAPATPAP